MLKEQRVPQAFRAFAVGGRTVVCTFGNIYCQQNGKFSFFTVLFNKGCSSFGGYIPIDCSNFITWLVFPYLLKVNALAFECTMIGTGEYFRNQTIRANFNLSDFTQYFTRKFRIKSSIAKAVKFELYCFYRIKKLWH